MASLLETQTTDADAEAWTILQRLMSDDDAKRAPEPLYARLHALGDSFRMPDGTIVVVSHHAVSELLRSPSFIRGVGKGRFKPAYSTTTADEEAALFELGSDVGPMLTALDPPDHTRLRALVQRAFMPRYVRALEAVIPVEIDRLIGTIDPHAPVDLVAAFSSRFAPAIMGHLIGLPDDQREEVAALSATFMRGVDPGVDFATRHASTAAGRGKRDIVRGVMADRRACPRDDFVNALVAAVPEALTEAECVGLLQIMYLGGYETTSHMIGNGVVRLLSDRAQFAALADDRTLIPGAVEEMLRIDSAIQLTKLVADTGAVLFGEPAGEGEVFLGLLGAANRDPDVYADPDRFDVRRKGRPHLAFGGGIHYCLGVNLARFELERVFAAFVSRFPRMRLADPNPPRLASVMQRAFERVSVILDP